MNNLEKLRSLLYPVAALYGGVTAVRNKLFDWKVLKSREFPIPIISVGNITVGGTGKTPHTEYLIRLLKDHFRLATLSRGYRRKTKGFFRASLQSTALEVGDEPLQMYLKFPDITVSVDEDRCHGIDTLLAMQTPPEVVILDDAFQHRYVKPGFSILIVDYNRPLDKDFYLPAGNLRESPRGVSRADVVIYSKCPDELKQDSFDSLRGRLRLQKGQEVFFTSNIYAPPRPVFGDEERSLPSLEKMEKVLLVTGIGQPAPLKRYLEDQGLEVVLKAFPDHHTFSSADVKNILELKKELGVKWILTTEKDSIRLREVEDMRKEDQVGWAFIPMEVHFLNNGASQFEEMIRAYLKRRI